MAMPSVDARSRRRPALGFAHDMPETDEVTFDHGSSQMAREPCMSFYELRQYEVRPGKMAAWIELMETEIMPFQIGKGMLIAASFRGEDDDSLYVWLRRFESEDERAQLYAAVYESDHWKTVLAPHIGELINRETISVKRIVPTRLSVLK
jgi:hypothetical protein